MTLEDLMAAADKLSDEERGRLIAYLDEKELEEKVGRRLAEAEADPSIMIPYEEGMARFRANIKKRNEESGVSSGSSG